MVNYGQKDFFHHFLHQALGIGHMLATSGSDPSTHSAHAHCRPLPSPSLPAVRLPEEGALSPHKEVTHDASPRCWRAKVPAPASICSAQPFAFLASPRSWCSRSPLGPLCPAGGAPSAHCVLPGSWTEPPGSSFTVVTTEAWCWSRMCRSAGTRCSSQALATSGTCCPGLCPCPGRPLPYSVPGLCVLSTAASRLS